MTNEQKEKAIEDTVAFLTSDLEFTRPGGGRARKKWDGAWWHMAILYEMEEIHRIPNVAVDRALDLLKNDTWPKFLIKDDDHPARPSDKAKMDCCHCELAVYYSILAACGRDVDAELPWVRPWFLRHQLPDGGLNCDPSAYLNSQKSSVVSTLPPLEAILFHTARDFTPEESNFLDRGAQYLIDHHLVCSARTGHVIEPDWLKPCFPRFFEYDILRGMRFIVTWSRRRKKPLPVHILEEGLARIEAFTEEDSVRAGRQIFEEHGPWSGPAFPLLELVSADETPSPYLTAQLAFVREALQPSTGA